MFNNVLAVLCALVVANGTVACGGGGHVRRNVDVDILWYGGSGPNLRQGLSRTKVSVEQSDLHRVRIGVVESASLQTGDMWRASIWMAAFQAAMATGKSLTDWMITVEIHNNGDRIDGPSAGGLITAAMMAGMTGVEADPTATMTGTVNPDGLIGPVSGIPQKFAAAVEAGKTRIGYPLGQRRDTDLATGKEVDIEAVHAGGDVEIYEVTDVASAYELLTGEPLRGPKPVSPAEMGLPEHVQTTLDDQTRVWLGSAQDTYQEYAKLGISTPLLERRWTSVNQSFEDAEQLYKAGKVAAAFRRAAAMFIEADTALVLANLIKRVNADEILEARRYGDGIFNGVDGRMTETVKRFKEVELRSPSDLMTLVDGFEAFGAAVKFFGDALAAREINHAKLNGVILQIASQAIPIADARPQLVELLYEPLEALVTANVNTVIAGQHLSQRPVAPKGKKQIATAQRRVSERRLERLSKLMKIAARANKTYFETTSLKPMADSAKISLLEARSTFKDWTWQHIRDDPSHLNSVLAQHLGADSTGLKVFALSSAFGTYISAAFLIAKYYSLQFELDDAGALVRVGRQAAFDKMLSLAEVKSREHAARAKKAAGEIPIASRIAYLTARQLEARSSVASRVEALEQYWRASMFSQLTVMLTARL